MLALAAVLSVLALLLRQPLLVAFLIAGILAGPSALSIVHQEEPLELLARLGVVLLLFYVGMKLDPRTVRHLGRVVLAVGTAQVVATSLLGFALARFLGFGTIESAYIGVGLSFSSTIVIVKLVADKRETETLHGRLAVGLLVVQDIWVIVVLVGLSLLGSGADVDGGTLWAVARILLAGAVLLGGVFVAMRWVLPRLLDFLARSRELLILFAVAWGVGLAAGSAWAGLTMELGAFVAGVSLASNEYREALASRLVSLRDFMLLFFFVVLGAGLDLSLVQSLLVPALVLSLFVFVLKPILVMAVFGIAGFRRRTNFLCASTMGQISEFGLILGALGVSLGHVGTRAVGLLTLVALITIIASTYVIEHNRSIYDRLRSRLGLLERAVPWRGQGGPTAGHRAVRRGDRDEAPEMGLSSHPADVIVFGLGRFGEGLAVRLVELGYHVEGVDLDPQVVSRCRRGGLHAVFGDAEDPDFPLHLPVVTARLVVSTIPQPRANVVLRKALEDAGFEGRLVVTAHWESDATILHDEGFRDVLRPFKRAAREAADPIADMLKGPAAER